MNQVLSAKFGSYGLELEPKMDLEELLEFSIEFEDFLLSSSYVMTLFDLKGCLRV